MRQPDFSTSPRPPRRALFDSVLLGLAALAIALAAGGSWRARGQAREATALLEAVRRDVAQDAGKLRQLEQGAGSPAAPVVPPGRVIAALATHLPRDVRVVRLELGYERGVDIVLHVEARTPASWDRLLEALASSREFADVQPGPEVRRSPLATSLRARWAGAAQ